MHVLQGVIESFQFMNDENIVLAIGNTGSGKSTLFVSLIYGVDALE